MKLLQCHSPCHIWDQIIVGRIKDGNAPRVHMGMHQAMPLPGFTMNHINYCTSLNYSRTLAHGSARVNCKTS
jgi:hypothetical protein